MCCAKGGSFVLIVVFLCEGEATLGIEKVLFRYWSVCVRLIFYVCFKGDSVFNLNVICLEYFTF